MEAIYYKNHHKIQKNKTHLTLYKKDAYTKTFSNNLFK